ncbi:Cobalt-precorrin 5A hydrolase [hydrothermal vent metagenome]|uniref:Cobalt-precorrin 5A hydrolase n=1 Tax=hydrothermal vent metagenome TaxID=652676 RepID=A0A3B1CBG0_9ZZZZ
MKIAIITLSKQGVALMGMLKQAFPEADAYAHKIAGASIECERFDSVVKLTKRIFNKYDGLVYIAPCGAVVRALAGVVVSKKTDPAIALMDVGGRHAISLLSGHEGGANDLTVMIANAVGAEPVITTTTEAVKNLIVGVGCKKDKSKEDIEKAINVALDKAGADPGDIRFFASADIKSNEQGLIEAAKSFGAPIRFIASEEIRNCVREFEESEFVKSKVNLPAVAEPSALLAGRRTSLILRRIKLNGVTVAIAKENCSSLG